MRLTTINNNPDPTGGSGFRIRPEAASNPGMPAIIQVKNVFPGSVLLESNITGHRDRIEWEASPDGVHWENFRVTFNSFAYYFDAEPGRLYYFRVRVKNNAGMGSWSEAKGFFPE